MLNQNVMKYTKPFVLKVLIMTVHILTCTDKYLTSNFFKSLSHVRQLYQKWFTMLPLHCANFFMFLAFPPCIQDYMMPLCICTSDIYISGIYSVSTNELTSFKAFLSFLALWQLSIEWWILECFTSKYILQNENVHTGTAYILYTYVCTCLEVYVHT